MQENRESEEELTGLLMGSGVEMEARGGGENDVGGKSGKVHQDYHLAIEIPDTAHQISQGHISFSFLQFFAYSLK